MIQLKGISKSFGAKRVLQDIDMRCERGAVTGVVGANGAGKTTLFRCIAGLYSHDGELEYDRGELQHNIGFLTTNPEMLSLITGREYLRLLCAARSVECNNLDQQNLFDLPLDEYAETYSTGMTKKLALTGILIQKNDVFLLDEPFSGIDVQSNLVIKELIFRLKSLNKIVIMSSHIFSALNEVCDVLFYLDNGQIQDFAMKEDFRRIETQMMNREVTDRVKGFKID